MMEKITYIFSGFSINEHFGKEVGASFKRYLKDCSNIVFIPGGMGKNDKTDRYVNTDVQWFKEIGVNIKKVEILDLGMDTEVIKNAIDSADILFLMGGDTLQQFDFISRLNIAEKIKNFKGAVVGVSAGAINLGKISVCSKDIEDGVEETKMYNGIGRINFTFEPHFEISNKKLLEEELYPISKELKIYGLTNDAGIIIYGDSKLETIKGKLYVINKNKTEIIE